MKKHSRRTKNEYSVCTTSKILVKIRVKHNLSLSDRCISFSQITPDHLFYLSSLKASLNNSCGIEKGRALGGGPLRVGKIK